MKIDRVSGRRFLPLVVVMAVATGFAVASPVGAADNDGTGPQPKGLGLGSAAALAQDTCSENGHTSFNTVGGGPFCVNPWPEGKRNGGATAQGVDATSVKAVAYIPNDQMIAAGDRGGVEVATGAKALIQDAIDDYEEVYDYAVENLGTYQLWGRQPELEVYVATGSDEAAQRADALAVIDKKPFMAIDMTRTTSGGAPVFATAVARAKILTLSASTTPEIGEEQSPYRWGYGADQEASRPLTAAFVGRALADAKASWAGDPSLHSERRAFGLIYPTPTFDLPAFEKELKSNGGTVTTSLGYDPTDSATFASQVPTMVTKLKSSGVTSVILFADSGFIGPLLKQATAQEFKPEWITTGYNYHEYTLFIRSYDQDQWAHAFGLSQLYPGLGAAQSAERTQARSWYWGNNGTQWTIAPGLFGFMYEAIQYAGPTLTAANVKKGLFAVPARGGAADGSNSFQTGYGNTVGMPYPEYSGIGSDRSLAWYDPTKVVVVPGNPASPFNGTGAMMYLDDGKRYTYKDLPKSEPKFFDPKLATADADDGAQFPGGVLPDITPCTGCPSSGAAPA
jgi:hypothetical protein